MTSDRPTQIDDVTSSIEASVYAACCADTIETVRAGAGYMNSLIIACTVDLTRPNENLTHLLALVG